MHDIGLFAAAGVGASLCVNSGFGMFVCIIIAITCL
jgi:hypothetical protein